MLKDKHGFMWFGTWNGLNRFDGYDFKVFKRDGTAQSLSDNFIYSLAEDHYGNIWIGTDRGLNIYQYEKDRIIFPEYISKNPQFKISGRINALLTDNDGNIWIGTDAGIHVVEVLDSQAKINIKARFSAHDESSILTSDVINTFFEDDKGHIWIGTNDGLYYFNKMKGDINVLQSNSGQPISFSNNLINAIYRDSEGYLWAGTYFGLYQVDLNSGDVVSFLYNPDDFSGIAHNVIRDIVEDFHGKLNVATLGGLSIFDRNTESFRNIKESNLNNYGLNNIFVSCLLSDNQGNLWLGTENGGVNRYNLLQNQFSYFEKGIGESKGLSHHTINSVFEEDQFIWIGTAGGGLNKYDKSTGEYTFYYSNPLQSNQLSNDFVTSIQRASDGQLYIGTWGGGLHRLEKNNYGNDDFYHFPVGAGIENALPDDFISSFVEDDYGYLWIGTREGLARLELTSGEVDVFTDQVDSRYITGVGSLQFDCSGNLWVGTSSGLFKILAQEGGQIHLHESEAFIYTHEPGNLWSISSDFIISILQDSECNMWFGNYGNGFSRYVEKSTGNIKGSFINYNETHGLANNVVYGILEDNSRNLWMSTDYGLSRFEIKTERFKNFYVSDGLKNNQYYWSAYFKNTEGKLYFGGVNGLNCFHPDSLRGLTIPPNVVIYQLMINNRPVKLYEKYEDRILLERSILNTDEIVLSHRIKEFSIGFSALLYDQPRKVKYAYKLDGYDEQWTEVDATRRFASYMNLPGGNYTFLIKATDSDHNWTSQPVSLGIHIIPPFYTQWWFISLMILLLIISIITYNRYKLYVIRLQKQTLEKKVSIRTSQIEDQKQKLLSQAKYLNESLIQLENHGLKIEEQNRQLEFKNQRIQLHKDKLAQLHKKVHSINRQQLNFFTNISHEFRTTLSLIISPLDQLLKNQLVNSDNEFRSNLELINKNAERLLRLINQLMDVRKIESGNIRLKCVHTNIVPFIRDITFSFTQLSEKNNIELVFDSSDNEIYAYFDKEKVENMLYNLISNAIKYTTPSGKIEIKVNKLDNTDKFDEGANGFTIVKIKSRNQKESDGFVEIVVKDNGIGIEPDKTHKIFQRFHRLATPSNNFVRGSGIGLFLTKELIRVHKGSLYLYSVPDNGSTFTIILPLGNDHLTEKDILFSDGLNPVAHVNNDSRSGYASNSGKTETDTVVKFNGSCKYQVLVVEDDDELRNFMINSMKKSFNVIDANNGQAGLEMARELTPDLILSDIMMPVMDGLELCEKLKHDTTTSHIPVILLTARSETEHLIEGLAKGADDYMTKPFNLEVLQAKISSLIENRRILKDIFQTSLEPIPRNLITNAQNKDFLEKAVNIIENNLANPELNVQLLAEMLFMSRSLLHKKLTTIAGQSANDFITSIRLKKSVTLLKNGEGNIAEVAYDVGFNDPKYFSRCFKKYFNLSPSDYLNGIPESTKHSN